MGKSEAATFFKDERTERNKYFTSHLSQLHPMQSKLVQVTVISPTHSTKDDSFSLSLGEILKLLTYLYYVHDKFVALTVLYVRAFLDIITFVVCLAEKKVPALKKLFFCVTANSGTPTMSYVRIVGQHCVVSGHDQIRRC